MTLSVADAPVDGVDAVVVQFSRVVFVTDDDQRESISLSPPVAVNLLELTGGDHFALLADRRLPQGRYRKIEFRVDAAAGAADSYVLERGSTIGESLVVPDEYRPQLTVSTDFTVERRRSVAVTVDFDLRRSLFRTQDGRYELRPRLRTVLDDEAGTVGGTASSALLDNCSGPAVYAFSGSNAATDDVDGLDPEPIQSAIVNAGDGRYAIGFLNAGSYTLAFTCDADRDEPGESNDDAVRFLRKLNVTIVARRATTVNFN
ncbi:DUF4382 domain-containing protein [Fontimonas sp. SYSU GA230001]|uniref:DUF4382 domain-containing protein n=1 Tax=Fontimonas sp. SYSU GA230001 TaxID=3142450 RepID=UPI0032B39F5D